MYLPVVKQISVWKYDLKKLSSCAWFKIESTEIFFIFPDIWTSVKTDLDKTNIAKLKLIELYLSDHNFTKTYYFSKESEYYNKKADELKNYLEQKINELQSKYNTIGFKTKD
ncbi:MAG TPA: hypothetical protein PLF31_00695 [Candidatus Paceibacterota bacterium]|nr:hypothetical protein [Candidatus Paceibacterota bacterium]